MTSQRLRLLESEIAAIWDKKFASTGMLTITGESVPLAYVSQRSIVQIAKGVLSCILLVLIGTFLGTRDLRLSALSTLAIVAPFTMSFGTWAWFGADFGLATSLVVAVTIGIIMDDTIHFIFRYQKGRRELDLVEGSAVGYAIHHSGVGIISSSVILVAGFLVLSLSSFTVNRYFGLGVCLTISSALIFTLLALPPLIRGNQTPAATI
jgi:predicted RND superfamily exporter protein